MVAEEHEGGWIVQCKGVPGAYCGLVVEGPPSLKGRKLPWRGEASCTYCPDCLQVMIRRIKERARHS